AESMVRRGLAHVPEGGGVIVDLTVEENLRLGGLWRADRRDRAQALDEVYELFPPLVERRNQPAASLSGGERQMVAIGRALMARPAVLLLDEPSLGLAPLITQQIMRLLHDLRDRTGLTVVLVEQNAASALSITDHGFVLSQGAVVARGSSAELLADDRMRHAYLGFCGDPVNQFISLPFEGIANGAIYAALGLSLVITDQAARLVNFAPPALALMAV